MYIAISLCISYIAANIAWWDLKVRMEKFAKWWRHTLELNFHGFVFPGGLGNWSTRGCKVASQPNSEAIKCECDHMTNFAMLFSASGPGQEGVDEEHRRALSIITYVGCAVSLVGVLLTLLTYTMFRLVNLLDVLSLSPSSNVEFSVCRTLCKDQIYCWSFAREMFDFWTWPDLFSRHFIWIMFGDRIRW